jgi:hypothetical protein
LFGAGLVDEQQKVRTITALAIAALAEAATPYGIESFDSVLKPLWKGIRTHRGKVRFLKCDKFYIFILKMKFCTLGYWDHLCGLVVRVLGYRSGGPGSIPGTTRKKK